MDPWELVEYVVNHWEQLTGESAEAMHEEGHFPEIIWELCRKYNVEPLDFQDAWTSYWG